MIKIYDFKIPANILHEVNLPGFGSVGSAINTQGKTQFLECNHNDSEFYFKFVSYINPGTIYKFDMESLSLKMVYQTEFPEKSYEVNDYITD